MNFNDSNQSKPKSTPCDQIEDTEHIASWSHTGPQLPQESGIGSFPVSTGVLTAGKRCSRCLE